MIKLFIDVETSGVRPGQDGIVQISGSFEINNKINNFDYKPIKLFLGQVLSPKATEIHGVTQELLDSESALDPEDVYKEIKFLFDSLVDKYNKKDKMLLIGYNCKFDYDFMLHFFKRNSDKYLGSYFWFPYIDIMTMAAFIIGSDRVKLPDFKQSTVAKYFGIDVVKSKLHDAAYDMSITRKLYYLLADKIGPQLMAKARIF